MTVCLTIAGGIRCRDEPSNFARRVAERLSRRLRPARTVVERRRMSSLSDGSTRASTGRTTCRSMAFTLRSVGRAAPGPDEFARGWSGTQRERGAGHDTTRQLEWCALGAHACERQFEHRVVERERVQHVPRVRSIVARFGPVPHGLLTTLRVLIAVVLVYDDDRACSVDHGNPRERAWKISQLSQYARPTANGGIVGGPIKPRGNAK